MLEIILIPDSEPIPRPVAKDMVSLPTRFRIDADFNKDTCFIFIN